MGLASAHPAAEVALALVRDDRLHVGRLADDAAGRPDAALGEVRHQAAHAEERRLLVIGQRQVDRHVPLRFEEARRPREGDRDEALHVGRAAAVDATVGVVRAERVARPVLPVDRHRVGVTRQHDAAGTPGIRIVGERREQVRLAPDTSYTRCERTPRCARWSRANSISPRFESRLTVGKAISRSIISSAAADGRAARGSGESMRTSQSGSILVPADVQ